MQLERFRIAKQPELDSLRLHPPIALYGGQRPKFIGRRGGRLQIIAEYKRASPSQGIIDDTRSPEEVAAIYTKGGASAISVLTERKYFDGRLSYLDCVRSVSPLPLLRKDFIFDELQVCATAATPASALLLMVALSPEPEDLRHLRETAESFGIQAVVEVGNEEELARARDSGARIIQVNNRNLETLKVDTTVTRRLIVQRHSNEVWIAASGLTSTEGLDEYDALLIGTALMNNPDPLSFLKRLCHVD